MIKSLPAPCIFVKFMFVPLNLSTRVFHLPVTTCKHYKMKKLPIGQFSIFGCGDRTWTCDLRVMSPTSYQLLYPATSDCPFGNHYINITPHIHIYDAILFLCLTFYPTNMIGAGDRGRTGTIGKDRRILSPVRLPIPPLRHKIGSEGGARTHSLPVNSRLLHHWAISEQCSVIPDGRYYYTPVSQLLSISFSTFFIFSDSIRI